MSISQEGAIFRDPYTGPPVLQHPYQLALPSTEQQQLEQPYITLPLPPCYPGGQSSQKHKYITQPVPPCYPSSMVVQELPFSSLQRPSWEQKPENLWGKPNLRSAASTVTVNADPTQNVVVVEDEEERQRRIEEADELAAKDVVCCCLGCVFGWIIC